MSAVNINVKQVTNFIGKFSKQHPIIAGLSLLSIVSRTDLSFIVGNG